MVKFSINADSSFEWSHHRISSTDSNLVRTVLQESILNLGATTLISFREGWCNERWILNLLKVSYFAYLLKLKTKIEGNCNCYRTRKIGRKLAGKIKIPKEKVVSW